MRDLYGGYISEGWLERRERAYRHAGKTPPPIVIDERDIASEPTTTRGDPTMTTTTAPYSVLTITDALPDGRPFEIRYLSVAPDATGVAIMADALAPEAADARKRGYLERLGLSPDAPPRLRTVYTATGYEERPDGCAWLAHWRDELARLNGTDSDTAKGIIRGALDAWDSPAALGRWVWVLA